MTLTKNLHWFIYILFLFSCARQSSPTGGPKDTIPPVLVRAIPPHETVNFKAGELELLFSEDVILNAPKEQLIITPTIGKEYKISYRRNTVAITFEEPLKDSTTYTFNFRESIQDITEKNPVRNLQLAYSTGTYIDSLSIEGNVFDLLTGKAIKDATVALHTENDTFNIFEHPATYFTKSDDQGRFRITNLKPDNYFLYAFQDKNRNLIVNSRSESYGFLPDYQYLMENIANLSVGLIRLDAGPLKITSARPYNTYFNIRTTKNLRTFKITAADSSELTYTFGETPADMRLYRTTHKDSLQIHLVAIDSIDNAIDTTLYAKYLTREVTPEPYRISLASSSLMGHTGQLHAVIQFTKPLEEINFDSIYFQADSLTQIAFEPQDLTWDPMKRTLTINKRMDRTLFLNGQTNRQTTRSSRRPVIAAPEPPAEKQTPVVNELHLRPAAFISIEQDSSEALVENIQPKKEQDLSVIHIGIKTSEEAFIVELLDNNNNLVRQVKNTHTIRFDNITPGEYKIRLIIDENRNGRWDPGNYFTGTPPEPIVYYRAADQTTAIKGVKANWVIGENEMFITY